MIRKIMFILFIVCAPALPHNLCAGNSGQPAQEDMAVLTNMLFAVACDLVLHFESIRPGYSNEGIKCCKCGYGISYFWFMGYVGFDPASMTIYKEWLSVVKGKLPAEIKAKTLQIANNLQIDCVMCSTHAWQ